MRYTIIRYYKGNYINPVPVVFTSLEEVSRGVPYSFILGQPNKLQQIRTTDDSLSVYVGNRSSDDFVVITREDNAFFNCWSAMYGTSQVRESPASAIESANFAGLGVFYRMFGNYLKSVTTQPELF